MHLLPHFISLVLCSHVFNLALEIVDDPVAVFPLQFSAELTIRSHVLEAMSDKEEDFPPVARSFIIHYDYTNLRARADVERGYEAAKVYIRRYDEEKEFMVRLPPINDCKRAYLGDEMPFPDLTGALFVREEMISGVWCQTFLHERETARVHMHFAADSGAPVKLILEEVGENTSSLLVSYEYSNVVLGAPLDSLFDVEELVDVSGGCLRHAGGFPFLHIFHHFVRF